MSIRRVAVGMAVVTAVAAALVACSSSAPEGTGPAPVVIAITEPVDLAPSRQDGSTIVMLELFSPLTNTTADGELTYVQAESITTEDAQTWTITLRDGWTFHDGTPVTAQDYVDTWNYVAYGPNGMENGYQLAGIEGYDALNPAEGEPTAETLSGLTVVDELTFTVALVGPDSQFPLQLGPGQTSFYPMPASAFDDIAAYGRKPIGNGPFALDSAWEDNTEFSASAYEDYAGEEPAYDAVTFRPYADAGTAYTDVLAGNADIALAPANKMTSVEQDFGSQAFPMNSGALNYLGFPLTDERYSDIRVRQAISMAIDRAAVSDAIYGGFLEPASALTAPTMAGYPEGICGEYCEFDPEAAKKLLDEAGGFAGTMELFFPGGYGFEGLMEAYANQIRQNLGIEDVVATPSTDFGTYYDGITGGTYVGPHWGNWGPLYQSQQNTLRNLFTATGGGYDFTGYSDPEVDALLANADAQTDPAEAAAGYVAAQERILEDFPIVPTFYGNNIYVTSARIADLPSLSGYPAPALVTLND